MQDRRGTRVTKVTPDRKDPKETRVTQDRRDRKVIRAIRGHRDQEFQKVTRVIKVILDLRVTMVIQDREGYLVLVLRCRVILT